MKVGSLFSGIGGLDLGLERAGMQVVWQVEKDPYCNKVLAKHWPEVPRYGDIKEIDFSTLPPVDLICGGFPCQPVSCAGKRQGDKDERWLWPEYYRAICEARPRWVLVENVPGLLSASDGRLFGGILGDLARGGYDAEWDLLPAAAVGAPHLRFRVFLVAHFYEQHGNGGGFHPGQISQQQEAVLPGSKDVANAQGKRTLSTKQPGQRHGPEQSDQAMAHSQERQDLIREPRSLGEAAEGREGSNAAAGNGGEDVADTQGQRLEKPKRLFGGGGKSGFARFERGGLSGGRETHNWSVEPDVGRVAHGIPSRVDRLKCLGNAVVPQVVEWIGRRIMEVERDG